MLVNNILYFLISMISPIMTFLFLGEASKTLSVGLFANLSLTLSVLAYFQLFSDFGSKDYFLTKGGKKRFDVSMLNDILRINVIIILLVTIISIYIFGYTGKLLLFLFFEFLITGYLLKFALVKCQLNGDVTKIKVANLLFALFVNGLKLSLLYLTGNIYMSIILSGIIGGGIVYTYLNKIRLVRNDDVFSRISISNYFNYLKYYNYWLPFLISTLSFLLYFNSDKLIIAWYLKPEDLAMYTIAATFVSVGELVCTVAWSILLPKADIIENNNKYRLLLRLLAMVGGISFFLIVLFFGQNTINLFFSDKYPEAYSVSIYLSVFFLFRYSNIINEILIINKGRQNIVAKRRVVCGLLNVLLNLIFIPYFGVVTAAVTTVLSEVILSVFLSYELKFKK